MLEGIPEQYRAQRNHVSGGIGMGEDGFFSLKGHVAVVTGGGQGIGEGIAKRLHSAGAQVAILDLNEDLAKSVAVSIDGVGVKCDVSSSQSVRQAVSAVEERLGDISILVNNAGVSGKAAYLWELDEKEIDSVYAVNLRGVYLMCHAIVGKMLQKRYGRILNVASIAGKEGNPRLLAYSATKAGVICLSKSLAKEVAGRGDITVNSISPAVVQTHILDTIPQETINYMVSRIPVGRTGKVEEIAALVHYLVSPEASFTTGQCYDISGGRATY
ncbi:MAG: SDR family NAD(P)-dependent oxidoreductase [Terriglobales bacterium]